ncbi:HAD-IIIC family phosphatase [Acidithiobacillus sp.]|nr:HAD-IIIC family phosphatase [Acidithiobacillus sp.]MCK9188430.1 HAD-IIIC family phosphatase [Acidithiobacillus sp.]
MESILSTRQNVLYFEINDIRKYYGDAGAYDGYVGHYSHAGLFPRSQQGEWICRDILDRLEGAWAVLCGKDPVKIIITDLDNTLWRGVLAEEEEVAPWRHTEGWPIGYAGALLECKRRGLLLAISSKNDEAPTCDRFRQVWGQALRLEDFCARQINWRPKSDNIADILQATNILPEQALFIDDNPLEIEEVRRAFPQMRFLIGALAACFALCARNPGAPGNGRVRPSYRTDPGQNGPRPGRARARPGSLAAGSGPHAAL